jgi:hypothetical protein
MGRDPYLSGLRTAVGGRPAIDDHAAGHVRATVCLHAQRHVLSADRDVDVGRFLLQHARRDKQAIVARLNAVESERSVVSPARLTCR